MKATGAKTGRLSALGRDLPVAEHLSAVAANVSEGGKADARRFRVVAQVRRKPKQLRG